MENRYVVRYGLNRLLGEFSARGRDAAYLRNASVVIRSDRGHEVGQVLCPATDRSREYLGITEQKGHIVREATPDDQDKLDQLHRQERQEFTDCKDLISQHKLVMQLVDVEHLFGGERLIFYYVAEARVDFRDLVKSLAGKFKTRIEMRQIGIRDEAKLLADYGDCGKPVCCNTHLREMPPVSMKMAKIQKATLDPSKISGRCGRLKCCLRYEYDTYEEYRRELPPVGSIVVTRQGQGKVIGQELLAKRLLIQYEGSRNLLADMADVVTVVSRGKKPKSETIEE